MAGDSCVASTATDALKQSNGVLFVTISVASLNCQAARAARGLPPPPLELPQAPPLPRLPAHLQPVFSLTRRNLQSQPAKPPPPPPAPTDHRRPPPQQPKKDIVCRYLV